MKKKYYIDLSEQSMLGFFSKSNEEYEMIPSGIQIISMPSSQKNDEYVELEKNNIRFITDDCIPDISLFTIPKVNVFAFDEEGYLVEGQDKIYYINKEGCWIVASHIKEFIDNIHSWKERLVFSSDIIVYASKEDAMKELEFIR